MKIIFKKIRVLKNRIHFEKALKYIFYIGIFASIISLIISICAVFFIVPKLYSKITVIYILGGLLSMAVI